MNISAFINNLSLKSEDWSDYLLPSAVNESKQMVKSNFFSSIYLIGAVCFLFIALGLYLYPTQDSQGQWGFMFFSAIMDIGLIVAIPMMLYQNMTSEMSNGSFELMSITSITPLKIVLGKWQSGLMQTIIFGSVIMPGLIYCYFFDGIAISVIFISFFFTFLFSQFAILATIFLCSMAVIKAGRLFLQLVSVGVCVMLCISLLVMKYEMVYRDSFISNTIDMNFVIEFSSFLFFIFTIEAFLVCVSAAKLSSYAANKSTAPRVIYSILILEVVIFSFIINFSNDSFYLAALVLFIHSIIAFFFLMEKEAISKKIYLELIQKNGFFRELFKRLFYPGRASAYLLFILQTLALCLAFLYCINANATTYSSYGMDENDLISVASCLVFYVSSIYITFSIVNKIFPLAKPSLFYFAGALVMLLIFMIPFLFYINSDQDNIWLVMFVFQYFSYNKTDDYLPLNLLIMAPIFLTAMVTAVLSSKRTIEKIRNYVAGERGSN